MKRNFKFDEVSSYPKVDTTSSYPKTVEELENYRYGAVIELSNKDAKIKELTSELAEKDAKIRTLEGTCGTLRRECARLRKWLARYKKK